MDKVFFHLYDNIYNYIAIVVYIYYQIHVDILFIFLVFCVFFYFHSILELFRNYEFERVSSFIRSIPCNIYVLNVIFLE